MDFFIPMQSPTQLCPDICFNTSDAGILFIVPPSFTIIPSLSASVIELPTDVSPSNKFSSEVVTVAPSKISNSASDIM